MREINNNSSFQNMPLNDDNTELNLLFPEPLTVDNLSEQLSIQLTTYSQKKPFIIALMSLFENQNLPVLIEECYAQILKISIVEQQEFIVVLDALNIILNRITENEDLKRFIANVLISYSCANAWVASCNIKMVVLEFLLTLTPESKPQNLTEAWLDLTAQNLRSEYNERLADKKNSYVSDRELLQPMIFLALALLANNIIPANFLASIIDVNFLEPLINLLPYGYGLPQLILLLSSPQLISLSKKICTIYPQTLGGGSTKYLYYSNEKHYKAALFNQTTEKSTVSLANTELLHCLNSNIQEKNEREENQPSRTFCTIL